MANGLVFLSVDPLAHVTRGFREYLLEKAVYALVTPGYKEHLKLGTDNSSDWQVMRHVMNRPEVCEAGKSYNNKGPELCAFDNIHV